MATPIVVIVTKEEDAVSNRTINLVGVVPCSQEEADTRIFVHATHATEAGSKVIMVKASDTDVVVIAVSVLQAHQYLGLQQLWVAFGQGQYLRWVPVYDLCCTLAEKSKAQQYEAIRPTRSALKQHVKRAAYQAGCIWSQSPVRQPETPTSANWGCTKKGDLWQIVWTELPPIAESCQQLTKCGCKSECCSRCKCYRFGLTCTVQLQIRGLEAL